MKYLQIKPNKKIALMLAKRSLAELVYDAVNLEGINFTLPEVQTLLDGVTIGGHKLHDQEITLNQSNAWKKLFSDVESNHFTITKDYLITLHDIAGRNEALEWGCFRTGGVTIAGTEYLPPKASQLDTCFDLMVSEANAIKDVFKQSIFIFLEMARYQFFYDVNKMIKN